MCFNPTSNYIIKIAILAACVASHFCGIIFLYDVILQSKSGIEITITRYGWYIILLFMFVIHKFADL